MNAGLSPAIAAYIAGLIDGEGTITLTQEHRNERRRLVISISSTERSLLEFVQKSVDAGCIANKRVYSPKHALSYTFKITNRQALALLRQVQPYMVGYKKNRAILALDLYLHVTPRNGRYNQEQIAKKKSFEETFMKILPPHTNSN